MEQVKKEPNLYFVIDISKRSVEVAQIGLTFNFPLENSIQERFLKGLDDIGITLADTEAIQSFENTRNTWLPSQR